MKILLAIDDSQYSQEALRTVVEQFRTKNNEVRVLSVVESMSAYISAEMYPHFVSQADEVDEDRRKQAKSLVQRTAQKLREAGFKTSEAVGEGNPQGEIVDQAEKWKANLIVLGSHGWKGLNRFLLGSVSDSVARHAHCSVEVVRMPVDSGGTRKVKSKR